MFWARDASCALLKVPMRASVSTTPRTRSSRKRSSSVMPSGCSKSMCHAASSPIRARSASRVGSGSVSVGKTLRATLPVVA